jgi:hypothetical protein
MQPLAPCVVASLALAACGEPEDSAREAEIASVIARAKN